MAEIGTMSCEELKELPSGDGAELPCDECFERDGHLPMNQLLLLHTKGQIT